MRDATLSGVEIGNRNARAKPAMSSIVGDYEIHVIPAENDPSMFAIHATKKEGGTNVSTDVLFPIIQGALKRFGIENPNLQIVGRGLIQLSRADCFAATQQL